MNKKIIATGILSLIVGFAIGSFITTRICFMYEFSGRSELLMGLRETITGNMQDKAISVIDHQIDSHMQLFDEMKNPFAYGVFFLTPSNIILAYQNKKRDSWYVKEFYKNKGIKLSPKATEYLNGVKSSFPQ
jgi:hypothetical protein